LLVLRPAYDNDGPDVPWADVADVAASLGAGAVLG
jgi:hypothetical protein